MFFLVGLLLLQYGIRVYATCVSGETEHTNIHGKIICIQKLATVLQSTASQCGEQGEMDIWVNKALVANEIYMLASDAWTTQQLTVSNTLNIPATSILNAHINNHAITIGKMSTNSVGSDQLTTNSVGSDQLITDSVGSSEIAENAVGASEIAENAVGSSEIASNAVGADEIASNAVGASELSNSGLFYVSEMKIDNTLCAADCAFQVTDTSTGPELARVEIKGTLFITESPTAASDTNKYYTEYNQANCNYYLSTNGALNEVYNYCEWQNYKLSIETDGMIMSNTYVGASDKRIKKEIQSLKDNESLNIIRKLDTKSYKYRDPIERGNDKVIGFIAQDVKEIIPSAVKTIKHVIPDEIRIVKATYSKVKNSWQMKLYESLKPGIYRFIFRKSKTDINTDKIKLETFDGKTFTVDQKYDEEVFLYGKEVDDFLVIDKQKIFAVAYSALQQVDKNQRVLQEKVDKLEKSNSAQAALIVKLEKRLDALESI